jgi:glutamate-ammonia-ligase adenylyltransferase
MVSRSNPLSELARLGFESLSETIPKLDRLVELVGDWGRAALEPLSKTASPDRALDGLIRLAEVDPRLLRKVVANNQSALRLSKALACSDFVSDYLQLNPRLLEIFIAKPEIPKMFKLSEVSRSELRKSYRENLIRIVDFDLSQSDPLSGFEAVSSALADLTDAALQAALQVAANELIADGRLSIEQIAKAQLAVISMGKTGARELNYISDVDVIYVCGSGEGSVEVAIKHATRMAACLSEADTEPGLWQVDANLRPEGKSGALVRTLEAHKSYYEKWAEPWEFQALLKARFSAGNEEIGSQYIKTITPMIWSFPDRSRIVESTRHLRKRVLDHLPKEELQRNIKLGRGGLRDVEFTAQLMQLVHGVSDESLRVSDTLSALDALSQSGLLARDDRDKLKSSYRFLRTIEHRIQLLKLRRTHLIPIDELELRRVARSIDNSWSSDDLQNRIEQVRGEVAELHDSVFYRPLLAATAALGAGDIQLSDEAVESRLRALGFVDAVGAKRHISALTTGVSRRATIQRTLLPVLIRWMAEGIDPDRALISFRRLSEALGESHWFLKMVRDSSGAAERLMKVLSSSSFIARMLEHIPDSSAWFKDSDSLIPLSMEKLQAEMLAIADRESIDQAAELLRQIRRREILRIAIGAVLGDLDLRQISEGLTSLVDAYILSALVLAKRDTGFDLDFGIVAMGRWGGSELGFGSDADAMFVYQAGEEGAQIQAEKIASSILALTKDSLLEFELDLGLRPEGKNGPRVRSLESYQAYYEKWAETWEFQALLRARVLSGSDSLRQSFEGLIDSYRYPPELSSKQLIDIKRIKARVESERLPMGADPARHLKLGRGSISDVEWVVQLYQLRHAHTHPELKSLGTLSNLQSLSKIGIMTDEQAFSLEEGWLIASRARSAMVLAVDKLVDILPTDRRQLEAIARIMEYQPGSASELEADYLAATRRSRKAFEELF